MAGVKVQVPSPLLSKEPVAGSIVKASIDKVSLSGSEKSIKRLSLLMV